MRCCRSADSKFCILQVSASGGHSEQQGKGCHDRVPQKGDVLEFEMAEESAPGGVEWLSGTVLKVDAKKKSFAALIKEDDNDESTWNEESYKVCVLLRPCVLHRLLSVCRTHCKYKY